MPPARPTAEVLRRLAARRCAPLVPAVAEAADRAGAGAVGLVGLGPSGLDLHLDRVGVTYGDGPTIGDATSPVRLTCGVVGAGHVPARTLPPVVARVRVDPRPFDVTDPDAVAGLRASVPGPEADPAETEAALAVLAADPSALVRGDPVALLGEAVARVPDGALPVVVTCWALARVAPERRLRLLQRLDALGAHRPLAWVSVEGVGVAPAVPTFGDRPASGHSLVGIALLAHATLHVETVGRTWSRGRLLSWLADER